MAAVVTLDEQEATLAVEWQRAELDPSVLKLESHAALVEGARRAARHAGYAVRGSAIIVQFPADRVRVVFAYSAKLDTGGTPE
jgi:hypothetical protein